MPGLALRRPPAACRPIAILAGLTVAALPLTVAATDWPAYHRDAARSGNDAGAAPLNPLTQIWSASVDGKLYASPVVASGKVIAATENNTVYAYDVGEGTASWQTHLGTPVSSGSLPCGNISPTSGITGTPVIDTSTGTVYAVTFESGFDHKLYALDLSTGNVKWSRTVNPVVGDKMVHQQRGALALSSGKVYIAYGGLFGDCGDFHGAVLAVNADGSGSTGTYTVDSQEAGIWAPAGPVIDGAGNIFVATGNGRSSPQLRGQESVVKLSSSLQPLDRFTPANWSSLDSTDTDIGSLSPALVDNGLAFQAGKDGIGYLLRQGALGGTGGEIFKAQVCIGEVSGGAAYMAPYLYLPCDDGVAALKIDASSFSVVWHGSASGSPIVAGGLVWALDPSGQLVGSDPAGGQAVVTKSVGPTTRFSTPASADGRLFVSLTDQLVAFAGQGVRPPDSGRPWPGGSDAVGVAAGGTDAYFAEGFTGANFREYLTVQNPGAAQDLKVQYLLASGAPINKTYALTGASRTTIDVNADVGYNQQVAAHLSAPNPFVAERPMYFNFAGNITGGHDVMGAQQLGTAFYFAEGFTGFQEYLTLMNPGATAATVTVTYYFNGGPPKAVSHPVAASSRLTVFVNDPAEAAAWKEVSMKVTSDQPILAERPMYFNFGGRPGGHVAVGSPSPSSHLNLAKGFVSPDFDEYLTILNPQGSAATVTITYFMPAAGAKVQKVAVAARTRLTAHVNDQLGPYTASSVHVDSDQPVVVERPMYFTYGGGWTGGHDAMAVDDGVLGSTFLFAEGFVSDRFAEYYTILNRNPVPATVVFTYYLKGGGTVTKSLAVPAGSRGTRVVNDDLPAFTENSVRIASDQPILAERPMYFRY